MTYRSWTSGAHLSKFWFPKLSSFVDQQGEGEGIVPHEWLASVGADAAPFAQAKENCTHRLHKWRVSACACLLLTQVGMNMCACSVLLRPTSKWLMAR